MIASCQSTRGSGIINADAPLDILPDGVTALDSRVELVQSRASPAAVPSRAVRSYHVLVPHTDVERLVAAGWSVEQ